MHFHATGAGKPGSVCTTVHPGGVRPAHPLRPRTSTATRAKSVSSVCRARRGSRSANAARAPLPRPGCGSQELQRAQPASGGARPVRNRVAAASDALERNGRELVARTGDQARVSGTRVLTWLGDRLSESGLPDEVIGPAAVQRRLRPDHHCRDQPSRDRGAGGQRDRHGAGRFERLVSRVMDSRLVDELTSILGQGMS